MEGPEEAQEFREKMRSPQTYICDTQGELYRAMRLEEAGMGQLLSPHVMKAGMEAFMKGHRQGKPTANPKTLGGTFIFNSKGRVMWEQRAQDASEFASPDAIRKALSSVEV